MIKGVTRSKKLSIMRKLAKLFERGITVRIFGMVFLILVWIITILGFGYYTVFSNLGSILTADHSKPSCELVSDGVRLRLGDSSETINFKFPLQIKREDKYWLVQTSRGSVSFSFNPGLRIKLKKQDRRRSSGKNGE